MTPPYLAIPTISGTAFVDQTLTASASATGDPAPTIVYQWQSSSDGDTWTNISGATSSTYVLASEDEGSFIRVQVVATNSEGSDTQISESIGPVEIEPVDPSSLPAAPDIPSNGLIYWTRNDSQ